MDCGLRRFGYFSFGNAWWSKVIRDDFCKELQTRGYDIFSYMPDTKEQDFVVWDESQRPLIKKWLRSLPRPIGIFTPGDLHSVCLLDICIELKIAVPEEVAILGRGNDPVICETVHPTLSSLDLNPQRLGYEAAKMLDQRMAKKKINEVVRIPPNFIAIRQSTNMMAIEDVDVAQALQYIRQFACKGIDVAQLVDHVGLSRRTLETRFSQMLGRSPKAEIIRIQIEHAKKLLTNTDKTSKNIARLCGFSSLEYFTIAFRREVGMKPQAYRKTRVIPHDTSSIPKRSDAGS
jgi:LacI family transcriptional regulator